MSGARASAATIGVFDGVHVGHQALIRRTLREARRIGSKAVVVTFNPDPAHVLHPQTAHPALIPVEARLKAIRALGVGSVEVIAFTRAFARLSPEQFVRRVLLERCRASVVVVGDDFAFGRGASGRLSDLRAFGRRYGIRVVSMKPVKRDGLTVSSSRIRRLIAEGKLGAAGKLLGRPPELHGEVIRGAGRGRRFGVPTANLKLARELVLPPPGVYAVQVALKGRTFKGVMNLGIRPTFGKGPLVAEVHLLNFRGNLYRRALTVSIVRYLRREKCFPSVDGLVRQIRSDIRRARAIVSSSAS